MQAKGNGVEKQAVSPHDNPPPMFSGDAVIQFGIFCCAVTLVIVLGVALFAR